MRGVFEDWSTEIGMGITIIQKSDLSVRKPNAKVALVLAGGAVTGGAFSITRDVYTPLVERGKAIYGFPYAGYWRDLGTTQSLEQARYDIRHKHFAPTFGKPR